MLLDSFRAAALLAALGAPALAGAGVDGCTSESGTGGTCSDGVALTALRAIAITRNAKNACVASSTSDAVTAFRRQ